MTIEGVRIATIVSSIYFICEINEVMAGALRDMVKAIIPTISTLVFMCLIRMHFCT